MNHKKKVYFSIILIAVLCMISGIVSAAPVSISTSKATVSAGESFTVTVSSDYIGRINVSAGNGITLSDSKVWVEKGSATITATAKNTGTYTITATPSELSDGTKDVEGVAAKTATVNVKDNSNNNSNNSTTGNSKNDSTNSTKNNTNNTNNNTSNNTKSNTNGNTNTNNTTQEPTFTTSNKTAYATGDINVRSSYSSSSSAVGYLKKGDSVTIIGVGSNGWSKVTYNGKTAYIKSDLLTATKPQEENVEKTEDKSTNKVLKSLDIESVSLEPEFNKDTTSYYVTVGKDVAKLNINAVAESESAKVTITGNENLQIGENTVKVLVTAEDGTVRTYTIIVKKQEEDTLGLTSLKISGVNLNESFKSSTYEYTLDLKDKEDLTKLDITAIANKEDATIEIIGNENFIIGENVITIMVKSKDGKENVTYQILVNKPEKTSTSAISGENTEINSGKIFLYVAIGIFTVALLLIILIIVRSIKKSKEDDNDEDEENDDAYGFRYNENNNITEELYDIKNKNKLHEEEIPVEATKTKLYDVEKEVDFSENEERRPRRKGKHSK